MAKKFAIKKNRSDEEMLAAFEEQLGQNAEKEKTGQTKNTKDNAFAQFFTPELQEQIGKELLKLKIKLYHEGIADFELKVKTVGNEIILIPKTKRKKTKNQI